MMDGGNIARIAIACLLASLPFAQISDAYHHVQTGSHTCTAGNSPPLVDSAIKMVQGELSNELPQNNWTFDLGPGEHHVIAFSTLDVDISVCKVGAFRWHACHSNNIVLLPETCLLGLEGSPHSGLPLYGPGTFRLDVVYCPDPCLPIGLPDKASVKYVIVID